MPFARGRAPIATHHTAVTIVCCHEETPSVRLHNQPDNARAIGGRTYAWNRAYQDMAAPPSAGSVASHCTD